MDLRYIERRSLLGDLRLLSATVPAVLSRRGAM
jgi:lipopolysaccharide/colanic/teichoic acid biosynthesis glycosyltransferase